MLDNIGWVQVPTFQDNNTFSGEVTIKIWGVNLWRNIHLHGILWEKSLIMFGVKVYFLQLILVQNCVLFR